MQIVNVHELLVSQCMPCKRGGTNNSGAWLTLVYACVSMIPLQKHSQERESTWTCAKDEFHVQHPVEQIYPSAVKSAEQLLHWDFTSLSSSKKELKVSGFILLVSFILRRKRNCHKKRFDLRSHFLILP